MVLPPDKRYASAPGPVNRRTALRERLASRPLNSLLQQRMQQVRARQLLGAPLSRQLGLHGSPAAASVGRYALVGLAPLLILVGAFVLSLRSGVAGTLLGGGLLSVGAAVGALVWRARARQAALAENARPVFDAKVLQQLDAVLEQLAAQVPEETLARLIGIKTTLVRMAPLLTRGEVNEDFTVEDRLYIGECLRRYLPDTLQAYLEVPVHLRGSGAAGELSPAQVLLNQQLDMLQSELGRCEQELEPLATEQMLRQQRFLEAKKR